ncbi:MAG: chromate efflux transporter [Gammaproteobacteria bacterium]
MNLNSGDSSRQQGGSLPPESQVSFRLALRFWLKLGFISFGGPAGQISIMHQELVEHRRWISENRFLHALNFTMLLPGPEAQQLATYIGWLFHGVKGGLIAGALFVLPSFFILSLLAWVYLVFGEVPLVQSILYGIKPAVTAVVLFAAWRIGRRALRNRLHWAIAVAAFLSIAVFNVPFPYIVLGAATIGLVGSRLFPSLLATSPGHGAQSEGTGGSFVIDDDTPPPPHARFKWSRLIGFLMAGLGAWLLLMAVLIFNHGWDATLTQMGWFFTKAALVTFGGAYAVLPYVYQGGVETYGWLTAPQMIDGLALGETTPGPLIMVVTFVGFVGGWGNAIFGADSLLLAGFTAAAVVTLVTFLPSFLFILMGGPAVEATRGDLKFTAPLSAITAAVVGVILNLAMFFAYNVLWTAGFSSDFEWLAAVIGLLAFAGLTRFGIGIIQIIGLAALAGLINLV